MPPARALVNSFPIFFLPMMSSATTPQQPEIRPLAWAGDPQLCPLWVGFPTCAGLPAGLKWSGDGAVPAIGARVHIYLNGFGLATVKAYFHSEGYLGVICAPDVLPDWYQQQAPGITLGHFFGRELEPRRLTPAPAPPARSDEADELARWSAALDQAHEANGNDPNINRADDWIPDHPPEDDEPEDNQDDAEYPEHPADEQRE